MALESDASEVISLESHWARPLHTGACSQAARSVGRALWPRCRCEVICKLCSRGEVDTASLKSEESWLVALALNGSLSIWSLPAAHKGFYGLLLQAALILKASPPLSTF